MSGKLALNASAANGSSSFAKTKEFFESVGQPTSLKDVNVGDEKIVDGKAVKEYFGSASEFQKGERKNVEGKKIFIDSKGSIFDTLVEMEQDLQSAISYAGGTTLQAIRKVDYVLVKNSIFNGDR